MLTLTARQCPLCVLRFGSSSELEQHMQVDHRPVAAQPQPEQPASDAQQPADAEEGDGAASPAGGRSLVRWAIVAAVLIADVAVVSWQAAALMSVVLAAIVAARAAEKVAATDGRWTP